jgi:hypothetical protein
MNALYQAVVNAIKSTDISATNEAIIAAIKANNNVIIDQHDDRERTLTCVGLYYAGKNKQDEPIIHVVCLLEGKTFCLNPIHVDHNGKPYLSTWSVGGVVNAKNVSMEQAIANFNDEQEASLFPSHRQYAITTLIPLETVAA